MGENLPDDWELELRVFHACGHETPEPLRELLKDLWKAYCLMEIRAIDAEQKIPSPPSSTTLSEGSVDNDRRGETSF